MKSQRNKQRVTFGLLVGFILVSFVTLAVLSFPVITQAQDIHDPSKSPCAADQLWLNVWIGTWCIDNIAEYIGFFYRFFVGTIGIFAVAMVMWSGMKWITASGNPEKISQAKDGITSAIIGVVIALISYILLNTINPMITDLSNPTINSISGKEFSLEGNYCEDMGEASGNEWWRRIGLDSKQTINCEDEYDILEEGADGSATVTGTCHGSYCPGDNVCYYSNNSYFCINGKELCKQADDSFNECREIDQLIARSNPAKGCSKRVDTLWKALWGESGDECHYGDIFGPPDGWTVVECGTRDAKDACWEFTEGGSITPKDCGGGGGEKRYCTNYLQRPVRGANSICIKKETVDKVTYKLWDGGKSCNEKTIDK